jgi:hypothetical protein
MRSPNSSSEEEGDEELCWPEGGWPEVHLPGGPPCTTPETSLEPPMQVTTSTNFQYERQRRCFLTARRICGKLVQNPHMKSPQRTLERMTT